MNNIYIKDDLGSIYSTNSTKFKVWTPTAKNVTVNLYKSGSGDNLISKNPMTMSENGLWTLEIEEDLNGVYYTYDIEIDGKVNEVVDIYAKALGVNGNRGMVVDLSSTDPEGFRKTERPKFDKITDAVIYEVHVRDFSIDKSSGMKNKGKFLGFTEENTVNEEGDLTGVAHLKDLGVTHVHLLPSFDYCTVDEENPDKEYNWGYDPKNYNAPEGSYSTDPSNGFARIKEFKEMVKSLHENGIRVVMDVVYNHTYATEDSYFNLTVPNYYHRKWGDKFSEGSGCGNDTASEKPMMRKFMIDSLKYWATEYMIDGFRFDLMGLHDVTTMNEIRSELTKIDPSLIIYGEGWTGGDTPLPFEERSVKDNAKKTPEIAYFSDDMRDLIKGSVFKKPDKGFVNGAQGLEEDLKISITGSIYSDKIDYGKCKKFSWSPSPAQVINYTEAHDNYTLWDKLYYSTAGYTKEDVFKMDKLAASIVMLSQGVPFIQAGQEFLRSKPVDDTGENFEGNSYKSCDKVNSIKWDEKTKYKDIYKYYKGLIELRKSSELFRLDTAEKVKEHLVFLKHVSNNVIGFRLRDEKETFLVFFNANKNAVKVDIPAGKWNVLVDDVTAGAESIKIVGDGEVEIKSISTLVLKK